MTKYLLALASLLVAFVLPHVALNRGIPEWRCDAVVTNSRSVLIWESDSLSGVFRDSGMLMESVTSTVDYEDPLPLWSAGPTYGLDVVETEGEETIGIIAAGWPLRSVIVPLEATGESLAPQRGMATAPVPTGWLLERCIGEFGSVGPLRGRDQSTVEACGLLVGKDKDIVLSWHISPIGFIANTAAYYICGVLLVTVLLAARTWWRKSKKRCYSCGYDQRADLPRCSECGESNDRHSALGFAVGRGLANWPLCCFGRRKPV